jgi:hypothetical protein
MRLLCGFWISLFVVGAVVAAVPHGLQAADDPYLGTWTGTWEGAGAGGSGGFEITLEKGKNGALSGRVSVTGEPTYKATLTTVSMKSGTLTATYDFTPDDRAEVALEATFEDNAATGTWVVREKASGSQTANGTWSVKRT